VNICIGLCNAWQEQWGLNYCQSRNVDVIFPLGVHEYYMHAAHAPIRVPISGDGVSADGDKGFYVTRLNKLID